MAKERRATLQPVAGQPSQSTESGPSAAAEPAAEQAAPSTQPPKRGRSGTGLYVELPRQMKVELDVVAAILQVPLNLLVGAVLSEYVSRDRIAELGQLAENYRASRGD
jgi:hypothetical protein